jgi:ferredoxin
VLAFPFPHGEARPVRRFAVSRCSEEILRAHDVIASGIMSPACIIQCMSLKILDTCVNCDVCEPACPNKAISLGEEFYVIDPDLCTECIGHHDEPQCVVVCPVECIITDPENVESAEQLDLKYRHLMAKESAA